MGVTHFRRGMFDTSSNSFGPHRMAPDYPQYRGFTGQQWDRAFRNLNSLADDLRIGSSSICSTPESRTAFISEAGRMIQTQEFLRLIKLVREATGMGLSETKTYLERYISTGFGNPLAQEDE